VPGRYRPDAAQKTIRERLSEESFGVAMIGGGVRMAPEHILLFERLINVLVVTTPGTRLCFNTSPEKTIDAIRRWVQPSL
jgi:thiamine pyrophosphate-dependent acetolactate synthase large subunit-like protein